MSKNSKSSKSKAGKLIQITNNRVIYRGELANLVEKWCEKTGKTPQQFQDEAITEYLVTQLELVDKFDDDGALFLDKQDQPVISDDGKLRKVTFAQAMEWLSRKHSIKELCSSPLNYGRFFELVAEKLPKGV